MKRDVLGLTIFIFIIGALISSIAPWTMFSIIETRPVDNNMVNNSSMPSFKVMPMANNEQVYIGAEKIKNSFYASEIEKDLNSVYAAHEGRPLWVDQNGPYTTCLEAVKELEESQFHGLEAADYSVYDIKRALENLDHLKDQPDSLASLDLAITANYLLYNYHLGKGRISADSLSGYWHSDPLEWDFTNEILSANTDETLSEHYKKLLPKYESYNQLRDYLARYSEIVEQGGWEKINVKLEDVIEPGSRTHIIPQIRKRLQVTDSMLSTPTSTFGAFSNPNFTLERLENDSLLYDAELVAAVQRFQLSHGLQVDGRIGEETLETLNITAEERLETIKLNLERMRWMPRELGQDYLIVNIPEYALRAYEGNDMKLKMKVIVGAEKTNTPIFSDTLKYVVFSPTWTVPRSIKINEVLPRLRRDSAYYTDRNFKFYSGWSSDMEVDPRTVDWTQYSADNFPFNVVQQPGRSNSLGTVKFIMPNNMSIYLHDTNASYLFAKDKRAMSHGCVRVEKPDVLASYLLRDQEKWNQENIHAYRAKQSPVRVDLKKDYHVQLTYFTAFVDENGQLNFRPDIYGHDALQRESIFKPANKISTTREYLVQAEEE